METNATIIIAAVVVFLVLAGAIVFLQRRSADRLRSRFGPEYERTVEQVGGRQKAQAQLHQREKRVQRLDIKPLTSAERGHYLPAWMAIQTQFVDDPKMAVIAADELLGEVMAHRGYPAGDFEQRFADLSVNHPILVQEYRLANDIVVRDAQGESNTEDLRKAMLYYRALFQELVGQTAVGEDTMDDDAVEPALVMDEFTVVEVAPVDESVISDGGPDDKLMIDEPAPAVEPLTDEEPVKAPAAVA